MPRFSAHSLNELESCDDQLQYILFEAIKYIDFSVLCGRRSKKEQEELVRRGFSKTLKSKHLIMPSQAVDIAPYPINWKDERRFVYFAGFIMAIAASKDIKLRWGGDWDNDTDLKDQRFNDLGHFELIE